MDPYVRLGTKRWADRVEPLFSKCNVVQKEENLN